MKESNLSLLHDRVVNYVDRKPKKSSDSCYEIIHL